MSTFNKVTFGCGCVVRKKTLSYTITPCDHHSDDSRAKQGFLREAERKLARANLFSVPSLLLSVRSKEIRD